MKKVLVISYSQTGQLNEILKSVLSPINKQKFEIHQKFIKPKKDFSFPWTFLEFMDTFPESINLETCEIEEMNDENDYDLVILAYQVWFLSPSIPITSFLKSNYAKEKLKNKPIITIIGCRNMWIMAQEKIKFLLNNINANLIDNIVLIDQGNSLATFITTPRWMLTGKKDSLWNIFPKAGISEEDIQNCSRFGKAINYALNKNLEKENKSICYGLKAVNVNTKLIKSEKIGTKSFTIWGKIIRSIGKRGDVKRKPIIILYTLFLILMIISVVPINMIIQTILRKINKNHVQQQKELYELPSGSSDSRLGEIEKYE